MVATPASLLFFCALASFSLLAQGSRDPSNGGSAGGHADGLDFSLPPSMLDPASAGGGGGDAPHSHSHSLDSGANINGAITCSGSSIACDWSSWKRPV